MRKSGLALAAAVVAVLAGLAVVPHGAASAPAAAARGPGPVALLATPAHADAERSEVRVVEDVPGASGVASVREVLRVTVPHARGAVVRGDVLAGGRGVVLVADEAGAADADWGAALHLVDARGDRILVRGLYHASRPLASADGSVYVERGAPGSWPTRDEAVQGRLRTDAIALDAVDAETGATRRITTWSGYTLHIAGELGDDLVVYRVAFEGADLVAIDRRSGAVRVVTPLLPFARDFSVDRGRGAVVMSNRDDHDSRAWVVDRIDLRAGTKERLHVQRDEAPVPYVTRDGDVRWSATAAAASPDGPFVARLAAAGERVEPIGGGLR